MLTFSENEIQRRRRISFHIAEAMGLHPYYSTDLRTPGRVLIQGTLDFNPFVYLDQFALCLMHFFTLTTLHFEVDRVVVRGDDGVHEESIPEKSGPFLRREAVLTAIAKSIGWKEEV